jgi:hypothetical protein
MNTKIIIIFLVLILFIFLFIIAFINKFIDYLTRNVNKDFKKSDGSNKK